MPFLQSEGKPWQQWCPVGGFSVKEGTITSMNYQRNEDNQVIIIGYDNSYCDATVTSYPSADDHVHNSQHCCDQVARWHKVKRHDVGSNEVISRGGPSCSVDVRLYLHGQIFRRNE